MPILQLIITLGVVGFVLWLINKFVPIDGKIKAIINVVTVIFVILWLLGVFGVFDSLSSMRIGK